MRAIVEVSGGVAEVTCGDALIIDWDEIGDDFRTAALALDCLRGYRGPDARRIRNHIREIWRELR